MIERVSFRGHVYSRDPESPAYQRKNYFRRKEYLGPKKFQNGKSKNGSYRWAFLHRDVWESFFGEIPEGFMVYHINGNPGDNDILNLGCVHIKTRAPLITGGNL